MELFLIRHGQSTNNAQPVSERVEDPPLTAMGFEQARHLGLWCRGLQLDRLFTSPFRRTLETTEKVRQFTGLAPDIWIALHEHGGCMAGSITDIYEGRPGMNRMQIEAEFAGYSCPEELDGRGWWKCKSHETLEQMGKRAEEVAKTTIDRFGCSKERIAYISHGAFLPALIGAFLKHGCSGPDDWLGDIANTAVAKLTFIDGRMRLSSYNSVIHLPAALVTGNT